jgi:site-specific recombinase XerD
MENELIPARISPLEAAADAAATYAQNNKAASTRRAYGADWRHFQTWCETVSLSPLPATPESIAAYLGAMASAGAKAKTIERRCTAIRHFHQLAGADNPAAHPGVKATMDGIRRTIGTAPKKKAALTAQLIARAIKKIPKDLTGLRDRALLLLGFAAALRRSELVAIDIMDLALHPKGLVVTLRRSKTDQAGAGVIKAVPHGHKLKAVAAVEAWIAASKITEGPLFRGVRGDRVKQSRLSDKQVARIVKRRAAAIGLDPTSVAGHSLRSGFITSAADAGAELATIAKHAGHAKIDTTLGYVQVVDAFRDHSGKKFL